MRFRPSEVLNDPDDSSNCDSNPDNVVECAQEVVQERVPVVLVPNSGKVCSGRGATILIDFFYNHPGAARAHALSTLRFREPPIGTMIGMFANLARAFRRLAPSLTRLVVH